VIKVQPPTNQDLSPAQIVQVDAFLARLDLHAPKVVVRWIDEPRIRPCGDQGFTVGHITRITLLGSVAGSLERCELEDVTLAQLKRVLAQRPIEVLYRSDNQTR